MPPRSRALAALCTLLGAAAGATGHAAWWRLAPLGASAQAWLPAALLLGAGVGAIAATALARVGPGASVALGGVIVAAGAGAVAATASGPVVTLALTAIVVAATAVAHAGRTPRGSLAAAAAATLLGPWLVSALGVAVLAAGAAAFGLLVAGAAAALRARGAADVRGHDAARAASPAGSRASAVAAGALLGALLGLGPAALHLTFARDAISEASIVAAALLGLAAGAPLASRRRRDLAAAAASVLIPAGAAVLVAVTGLGPFAPPGALGGLIAATLLLALAVLAAPAAALTSLLERGGAGVGLLAAAAATAVVSRLLLPAAGLWPSLALVSAGAAALAAATGWRGAPRAHAAPSIAIATALSALAVGLAAGPTARVAPGERVRASRDGVGGRLERVERRGHTRLRRDGRPLGSDNGARDQRQARLPWLLHPAPRRIVFLGDATTALAAALAGLAPTDAAITAIDPGATVDVAPRAWLDDDRGALDVLVSVIHEPWSAAAAALASVEHQRAAAARLDDRGVHVVWLDLWHLGAADVAAVADAARAVFPHVALWRGDTSRRWGTLAVIASRAPIQLRGPAPEAARLAALYVGDWPGRANATPTSDERPRLALGAAVRTRDRRVLIAAGLVGFYRTVLAALPRRADAYVPADDEPAWNPDAGFAAQLGAAGADGEP